jgi:serine phosphatase RsbU (regulator of sigma subunit)/ketosteroid isomerase-like protein
MSSNKKIEQDVLETFRICWHLYAIRDFEGLLSHCSPGISFFGTGEDEKGMHFEEWQNQITRDFSQIEGSLSVEILNARVRVQGSLALVEGEVRINMPVGSEYVELGILRVSEVFEQVKDRWLVVHLHCSLPYPFQEAGESYPIDALVARNRELEEQVVDRTAQLQQKTDELQKTLITLKKTQEHLRAENERKTKELEKARRIQLSMLPSHVPKHPAIELTAYMSTATEVGGDYYDFHLSEDGTLTLAIGDATGHGVEAGIMVAVAKSLFINYVDESDILEILRKSSNSFKRIGVPNLYMSFALARFRNYTLELAGAGMPPALIYRIASKRVESFPLKGLPLGGPQSYTYKKQGVTLAPGDSLVLMSDGLPELFNLENEILGYNRVISVFEEVGNASPDKVIEHFTETANAWAKDRLQADDITFIVMKIKK